MGRSNDGRGKGNKSKKGNASKGNGSNGNNGKPKTIKLATAKPELQESVFYINKPDQAHNFMEVKEKICTWAKANILALIDAHSCL